MSQVHLCLVNVSGWICMGAYCIKEIVGMHSLCRCVMRSTDHRLTQSIPRIVVVVAITLYFRHHNI